ncbi:TetR/AcrR family transcriptional regulator [Paenibacillus harenae]|uniref:AcrR family transcriptional regulator n=1 Tax=Paenibacillus harenae TaxID=306543 RepID=A0ABT9U2F1_PAEHA|nr:TetR/AcrR family transcriptional regulator [Paenibacillus harenae]MDQ0059172.1 AcrR family transcriptional regulator [Paenibacillus harenae]MDQ0112634.1 AcrR family transcriptional regulator [Paenibacillus harenae]
MLREARKQETKKQIIYHAVALFKQKGYENVTVEEITKSCGIAKGTFFNYFEKKEHILLHVADSYTGLMSGIVQKQQEGELKSRLLGIFGAVLAIYVKHADIMGPALIESLKTAIQSDDRPTNIAVFQETIHGIIEAERQSGSFRSRWESSIIASLLTGIFVNVLVNRFSGSTEEKMLDELGQQLEVVWKGVAYE